MTQRNEFEVHLELYEGPVALLLHLIEKNNLNIFDIPIAKITQEYLKYIDFIRSIEAEVAGEFLVMAATLMQIKARLLLPVVTAAGAQADPREELINRLLMAQRFGKAAQLLAERARLMEGFTLRPPPVFEDEEYTVVQTNWDLMEAFKKVLEEFEAAHGDALAIRTDPYPVEAKMEKIQRLLIEKSTLPLKEVWESEQARGGLIACFLAVLELIKRGFLRAVQKGPYGEIFLVKVLLS
ncbi:MAG: segregation/condensation protein A [Elusimicrobia bacterium]|nr:segregation/condensation protein A [Elusimicrobiota bacterium]